MDYLLSHYNYWVVVFLMMLGFYIVISRSNMVKVLAGLSVFQTSVFIFYISLGKIRGATAPILVGEIAHGAEGEHAAEAGEHAGAAVVGAEAAVEHAAEAAGHAVEAAGDVIYSNPLTSVLILTAIVVSIATTALGLAIVVRIREAYGTIEEEEIDAIERVEDIEMPDVRWT